MLNHTPNISSVTSYITSVTSFHLEEKGLAEINTDMAEKHGIVEDDDNDDDVPVKMRENPFATGDDSFATSTVRINNSSELRPPGSKFGWAMTRWRKSQTNNDTEPFEMIQKK